MPKIEFSGSVFPPSVQIECDGGPMIWKDQNINFSFEFSVHGSSVLIGCTVGEVNDLVVNYAHHSVMIHVGDVIDAIAVANGTGLRLLLDCCTFPDGSTRLLKSGSPKLAQLCPFTPTEIIAFFANERRLLKPLNDLVQTLFSPLESFVNCQRAIESIEIGRA